MMAHPAGMAARESRNLIALDLLRFACALLVLAYHYGAGFALLPPPGGKTLLEGMPVDASAAPFVMSGWIGVELFFVVSGFVIAWSAEGSRAAAFLGRRALRLLPAAWICASLTGAALLAWSHLPAETVQARWLGSMIFWPTTRPIDPSYWTLAIEVNFYLLVAAALALRGGATPGRVECIGALLGAASCAYWLASLVTEVPPATNRLVHLTLLPHGCFFALGILIRVGQRRGWSRGRIAMLAPAAIAALIEIEAHCVEVYGGGRPEAFVLFGLGMLSILFGERMQPWLECRLPARRVATLGLMTYPLYLLHQELSAMLIGGMLHLGGSFWPAAAVAFAAMLLLSWLVVRVGEPAIRAVLRRLAPGRSVRAVPFSEIAV